MKCYSRGVRRADHAAGRGDFCESIKYVYLENMQRRSHLRGFILFGGEVSDNQMSITEVECEDTSYIVLD